MISIAKLDYQSMTPFLYESSTFSKRYCSYTIYINPNAPSKHGGDGAKGTEDKKQGRTTSPRKKNTEGRLDSSNKMEYVKNGVLVLGDSSGKGWISLGRN